tara:strand:- start:40 stop:981 length:942 start_codon:yes stop_codon:yes gene_type:complete
MSKNNIVVYSFYRFLKIDDVKKTKNIIQSKINNKFIKGTILISEEGINGCISGKETQIDIFLREIKKILRIRKISLKINYSRFVPFYRLKIKIKNEIVTLGKRDIKVIEKTGKFVSPKDWREVINNKDIKIIDTRNQYEIEIGKFKNSININMDSFRDFPELIKKIKLKKEDEIAMYCTGGIRCEKASSYLIKKGFKNILQLDGGILNYLNYIKDSEEKSVWKGECFVFDNRVSVNKNLKKGSFDQCYGCRYPITNKEKKSKFFKKGIHCPRCYKKKNQKQLISSSTRQHQINIAEKNKTYHPFKKLFIEDLQ